MEKVHSLSICRICLVDDVRMHSVLDKKLQEFYEKLSSVPFETGDSRPSLACYMCYQRLWKCHQFAIKCMQTEAMFTRILTNSNKRKLINIEANSEPFQCLSVTSVLQIHIDGSVNIVDVKEELPDESEQHDDDEPPADFLEIVEHKLEDDQLQSKEDDVTLLVIKSEEVTEAENIRNDLKNEYKEHSRPKPEPDCLADTNLKVNQQMSPCTEDDVPLAVIKAEVTTPYENKRVHFTSEDNQHSTTIARLPKKLKKSKPSKTVKLRDQVATMEKPYKCDVCNKRFIKNSHLIIHSRVHSGERPYKCDICQSSFKVKSNLTRHTLKHTGEKLYECNICQYKCRRNSTLIRHIRIHSGKKPYKCDICQTCFKQKNHLIQHIPLHTGEKTYKCDICQSSFRYKSNRNRHMQVHADEKPYKCDICQCSFKDKSNLTRHILRHTVKKPYKCDICQRRFSRKAHQDRHILVHTDEKPYKCNNFVESSFKDKTDLTKHEYV